MNDNNLNNNINVTPEGNANPQPIPNPVPPQPVQPQPMPNTELGTPQPVPMNNGVVTPPQPVQPTTLPNQPAAPTPMPNPVEQPVMGATVQEPQPMTNNIPNQNNVPPTPQQPNQMTNQSAQPQPMPQQPVSPQKPPKQKSSPLLIVLMFVAIIGGAAYFGYNKFFANSSSNNGDQGTGTTVTDNIEDSTSTAPETIAKEKMPIMIVLSHKWNYCGKANTEDTIHQNDSNNIERTYWASVDFKSIEELKNYMNSLMSEKLIKKNYEFDNKDYFIEKDGKLYYQPSNKDCGYDFVYDNSIINEKGNYQISNESDNSFDVVVTLPYTVSCEEKENTLTAKATFTKEGNNWIISKYEDDAIYQVKY